MRGYVNGKKSWVVTEFIFNYWPSIDATIPLMLLFYSYSHCIVPLHHKTCPLPTPPLPPNKCRPSPPKQGYQKAVLALGMQKRKRRGVGNILQPRRRNCEVFQTARTLGDCWLRSSDRGNHENNDSKLKTNNYANQRSLYHLKWVMG